MLKRSFQWVLLACLATGTLYAATDSFVGDWKLNPSKSKLIDKMKVESFGGKNYVFDLGGGPERIVIDSTDQPTIYGTILSVTVLGPDSWKVVRKKDGRILLTGMWKLSQDENTLSDHYTEFPPNGAPSTIDYVYKRTAVGQGFAGTWESPTPIDSASVLRIRPYEEKGLSLINSSEETPRNVKLDGKDYPNVGRHVAEGATISGRRVDEHTLEITEKTKGEVTKTQQIELSSDLKTLTITVHLAGQHEPNVFLFERQ
jgi:hypothetical protein